jgi:glycerol uptake facilitator-like aquaporin
MIIVVGCARGGRTEPAPFAMGAWLAGAILATPSGSYANPAIALAAVFAVGPASLQLSTAFVYVLVQLMGAFLALVTVNFCYGTSSWLLPARPSATESES